MLCVLAVGAACSRNVADVELADAQAEADEATAQDFTGATLHACGLLSSDEVRAVLGELAGPPQPVAEDARDSSDSRCLWRSADGRELTIGGAHEGGPERLAALAPHASPQVPGNWQQARLQGCCVLHAVQDETLVSLDFSGARIDLTQAALLMNAALARRDEPLDSP